MKDRRLILNGQVVNLSPTPIVHSDALWVPLEAFCQKIGAHIEQLEGEKRAIVCQDDRCVPLTIGEETVVIDNIIFAPLAALADPLGLHYHAAGEAEAIDVAVGEKEVERMPASELSIGKRVPDFTFPDVWTGKPIALSDFVGKKTLVFAWASW